MPTDRFWAQVEAMPSGCWLWRGCINRGGYGVYSHNRAHRLAFQFFVGEIPPGLDLDHVCRVRNCINPTHLEPVTRRENISRSPLVGRWKRDATHCAKGHDLSRAYVYTDREGVTRRLCRFCAAVRRNAARAARRAHVF